MPPSLSDRMTSEPAGGNIPLARGNGLDRRRCSFGTYELAGDRVDELHRATVAPSAQNYAELLFPVIEVTHLPE
jgi:hypothetical protein